MEPIQYEKRGYLRENFRIFHLADNEHQDYPYHYHTFHKVILMLAGRAGYAVEGEHYTLQPGDFVLVGRGSIHRPELEDGEFYERIVFYISPEYLRKMSIAGEALDDCFRLAQERFCYVYKSAPADGIQELFSLLERAQTEDAFGKELLCQSLFTHLMVRFNRIVERSSGTVGAGDNKVLAILQYLNSYLTKPMTIDELADRFYISKYHMMRRFRQETGYTIHGYMTEKRLLLAQQLLLQGFSLSETAARCGYQDYSTFSRAFKKKFGRCPSEE